MKSDKFEQELAELRPDLFRLTRKFTKNKDDSMDLVQDTIMKALSQRSKFRNDINLKGWLYVIMRNTFINQYRKDQKTRNRTVDESYLNWTEETHSFNKPDSVASIKEIWTVINSIKRDLAKPFKMYLSGYKYHEIAEHLDLPLGTVKNRIFQARIEIQNHLTGYC